MLRVGLLLFLSALQAAAEDIPREVLLLARTRAHMSHLLMRLPNYTCLQTIERTSRKPGKRMELIDVVRIEVALVNGRELFAWPGSKKFEDREIVDMVKGGAIGNGNFALHAKAVFQSSAPRFTFSGERILEDGRKTLHWDFVVPQLASGYALRQGSNLAIVGFHGSFWVDSQSLDLIRLEVEADNIPPALQISRARDSVEYIRIQLGDEAYLLPSKSELVITDTGGTESQNRIAFSGCRQYTGESTISFDDPAPTEKVADVVRTIDVPPGLTLDMALETPITEGASAVGDPITAILKKSVKLGSGLIAPKGAFVHGRIAHLRRQQTQKPGWVIGLAFFEMEWQNTRANIRATLQDTPSLSLLAATSAQYRSILRHIAQEEGTFFVPGQRLSVARGFLMSWRTEPIPPEDNRDSIRTRD